MFRQLAVPHDVVYYRGRTGIINQGQDREENVEPLPEYIADVRAWKEGLTVTPLDTDGKPLKPASPSLSSIRSIEYYEQLGPRRGQGIPRQASTT